MTDAVLVYRSEGFYGDVARIEIAVSNMQSHGCDFIYKVTNKETGKELARAKTGILFYDYAEKKILQVPKKFKSLFSRNI